MTAMCKDNDRPAHRKCHCSNTFGVKMSLLFLNKLMIATTEKQQYNILTS